MASNKHRKSAFFDYCFPTPVSPVSLWPDTSTGKGNMESSSSGITLYPYLASLNQAQLKGLSWPVTSPQTASLAKTCLIKTAVTTNPSTPLQILAGPGSGKTRVLTCRVAYLVQHYKYSPNEIVAVTFTNKSANEMRKRLQKLLGDKQADQLVLGKLDLLVRFCTHIR